MEERSGLGREQLEQQILLSVSYREGISEKAFFKA